MLESSFFNALIENCLEINSIRNIPQTDVNLSSSEGYENWCFQSGLRDSLVVAGMFPICDGEDLV